MARRIGRVRRRTVLEIGNGGEGRVHMAGGRRCPVCAANLTRYHHNPTAATTGTDPAVSPATASNSATIALDNDDDSSDAVGPGRDACVTLGPDFTTGSSINNFSQHSTHLMVDVFNSVIQNLSTDYAISEASMTSPGTNHSPTFRNINVNSPLIAINSTNAVDGYRIRVESDREISHSIFSVDSPHRANSSTIAPEVSRATTLDDVSRTMTVAEVGLNVILAFNLVGSTTLV